MNGHAVWIGVQPRVKGRPRLGARGRVYTPKRTLIYEEAVASHWDGPRLEGPVAVTIMLHRNYSHVSVKPTVDASCYMPGDIDNYAKSILDGLNGVAYLDDAQIMRLSVLRV